MSTGLIELTLLVEENPGVDMGTPHQFFSMQGSCTFDAAYASLGVQ
jgi:hypothetical protein